MAATTGKKSVAICPPTSASPLTFTRTNRKPFTSFPSKATASIMCTKESCVCIAAAPAETNGSRSPRACRKKIATSTCCATPWPSIRWTNAASILAPPVAKFIAPPMPETVGRPSCAICRPSYPSKCKRCDDRFAPREDPDYPPAALARAGACQRRDLPRRRRHTYGALRARRARSHLPNVARYDSRSCHAAAPPVLALLRVRRRSLSRIAGHSAARGRGLRERAVAHSRRHRRWLTEPRQPGPFAKTSGKHPILFRPRPSLIREDGCAKAHRALGESSSIKGSPGDASAPSYTRLPRTGARLAWQPQGEPGARQLLWSLRAPNSGRCQYAP